MHRLSIAAALLAVLCCSSVLAEDDVPPPDKTGGIDLRDPAVIERGMQLLNTTCGGYCHGSNGRGFKAPALRARPDLTVKSIHSTVLYGRKRAGKMMPPWKGAIPDSDIWSAVAAIVSLRDAPPDLDGPPPATH